MECRGIPTQTWFLALCSQGEARCQRGTFQGEVPHCSPFPIVASFPCGQISCLSLALWFHGVEVGKTDAEPPRSSCAEEENSKVSSSQTNISTFVGRHIAKNRSNAISLFTAIMCHQGFFHLRVHESEQVCLWKWRFLGHVALKFWFSNPAWFLLAELPCVPSDHLLQSHLWVCFKEYLPG